MGVIGHSIWGTWVVHWNKSMACDSRWSFVLPFLEILGRVQQRLPHFQISSVKQKSLPMRLQEIIINFLQGPWYNKCWHCKGQDFQVCFREFTARAQKILPKIGEIWYTPHFVLEKMWYKGWNNKVGLGALSLQCLLCFGGL